MNVVATTDRTTAAATAATHAEDGARRRRRSSGTARWPPAGPRAGRRPGVAARDDGRPCDGDRERPQDALRHGSRRASAPAGRPAASPGPSPRMRSPTAAGGPSSSVHDGQPARCAATAWAVGVSPAISRSSPPGSTAARSSCSRVASWSIVSLSILAGGNRHDVEPGRRAELRSERFAQTQERPARPCLDGPERPSEPIGDLRLREVLLVGQQDDRSFDLGHLRESAAGSPRAAPTASNAASGARRRARSGDDGPTRDQPLERLGRVLVRAGRRRERHE